MYSPSTSEQVILTLVGQATTEPVKFKVPTRSTATTLRAQSYALAKRLKRAFEGGDLSVDAFVTNFALVSFSITEEDGAWYFLIRRKDETPGMLAAQEFLKAKGVEIVDPVAEAAKESERRLLETLGAEGLVQKEGEAPKERFVAPNPYYTRR